MSHNNPSTSAMPGMTLNFDAAGMDDKIEEELKKENEEEQKKIRQLLEAELNDDDLLSEEDSDELSQEDNMDDELRNTDDLTQKMQQFQAPNMGHQAIIEQRMAEQA